MTDTLIEDPAGRPGRLAGQKESALWVLAHLGEILPPMDPAHVDALADSMRLQGYFPHEPILRYRLPGKAEVTIIGRHREAAAAQAEVEPAVEYFRGDPVEAVYRMTASVLGHRYLSTEQRASVTQGLKRAGYDWRQIVADRGLRVSRDQIAEALLSAACTDKPLTHRAVARVLGIDHNHVQVNRVCAELVEKGSLASCPHRFTEKGVEAPGRRTGVTPPPREPEPAGLQPPSQERKDERAAITRMRDTGPEPVVLTDGYTEGVVTEMDIMAARTDLRGECTCEFTPVGPGQFVRPVTDPHCPVHNEVPAPLVLPVPVPPGQPIILHMDTETAALDSEIRRRLLAGEPTEFRALAERFGFGPSRVQNRIQWNQGWLAARGPAEGCTHGCPAHCPGS